MQRGDIYIAHIHPRSGSEQHGTRPVIIVSHPDFVATTNWNSLLVVPITTSSRQIRFSRTITSLPKEITGLSLDSIALAHQLTTLDRSKLQTYICSLPEDYLSEINTAMIHALGISTPNTNANMYMTF